MSVPMPNMVVDLPIQEDTRQQLSIKDVVNRYHHSLMSFLRQRVRIAENAADVAQDRGNDPLLAHPGERHRDPKSICDPRLIAS